jgi:Protein of unknown function, DUF547
MHSIRTTAVLALAGVLLISAAGRPGRAQAPRVPARDAAFDELLDQYVRDGLVYYRAIKSLQPRLDGYVASLSAVRPETLTRDGQVAFWLNAYNAIVLQTVASRYPIAGRSDLYPAGSIRQIPGAFERITHAVGGRVLTLDQIEVDVLAAFGDPRVFLALGRGAVGSGRLRSEAYTAERLDGQLESLENDCPSRSQCLVIDAGAGTVAVSSVFSWREQPFVAAYAEKAPEIFATRSPIERAILTFIQPRLLGFEREFLDANQFRLAYIPFDWHLNDLTGR